MAGRKMSQLQYMTNGSSLLLCSNELRTQLLIDNTDKLGQWLEKGGITDQELAYWLPKYILMRGGKPFADMVTQEEIRRDSTRARVAGWNSPGKKPSQKLIFT